MLILGVKDKPKNNRKLFPTIYNYLKDFKIGEYLFIEKEFWIKNVKGLNYVYSSIKGSLYYRNLSNSFQINIVFHPLKRNNIKVIKIIKIK